MSEKSSIQIAIEIRAQRYMLSGVAFSRAYALAFVEILSERGIPLAETTDETPRTNLN
jgi:hypothetical protein